MKNYVTARLSENISETPEGYLVCSNVPLTRTGELLYAPQETPVTPGNGATVIKRTAADIFDERTVASFEGKPVTIGHPDEFVGPDNWQQLSVGVIQNVRPGSGEDSDKLLGDLLITDREAIFAVKNGLREVSCGYNAEYVTEAPGIGRQTDITGNHLALVPRGRCGPECAIFDHAAQTEKGNTMSLKDKLLAVFGKALDTAMAEEQEPADPKEAMDACMKSMDSRIAAIEDAFKKFTADFAAANKVGDSGEQVPEEKPAEPAPEEKPAEPAPELTPEEVANVEVIAPGLEKTADAKPKALKALYATKDGKAILASIVGAKAPAFDSDVLFNAAAALIKAKRSAQLAGTKALAESEDVKTVDYYSQWNSAVAKTHQVPRI